MYWSRWWNEKYFSCCIYNTVKQLTFSRMKQLPFIALFFLFTFYVFSQNNFEKKDGTIKVSNPLKIVTVEPKGDELFIGRQNKLKIKISGKGKIDKIVLDGGTITGKDSIYIAQVTKGTKAILSVYEKTSNGNSKLIYTKPYRIFKIPEPIVMVDDVRSDSVINKQTITAVGRLSARMENTGVRLKILSFNMQMANSGTMDTLRAQGNSLTRNMRKIIDKAKDGSLVYFDSIQCVMPDSTIKILNPIRIYIKEEPVHLFGM